MSTDRPSVRSVMQASSAASSSMPDAVKASIAPDSSQPASITFSSKTSRVPCLVPGTKARISCAGRSGFTSAQVAAVLSTTAPSRTTLADRALNQSAGVKAKSGLADGVAKTMPS